MYYSFLRLRYNSLLKIRFNQFLNNENKEVSLKGRGNTPKLTVAEEIGPGVAEDISLEWLRKQA